jgi:hypothetical protein
MRRWIIIASLLFSLAIFAPCAHGVVTPVADQACSGSSVGSCTTGAITVSAGDLIFCEVMINDLTSVLGCNDSQSDTYTSRVGPTTGDNSFGRSQMFTGVAAAGGSTTFSCTNSLATATDFHCAVWVFHSSVGSAWVFDTNCTGTGVDNSGGATRTCSPSMTVASASVVILGNQYVDRAGGGYTAGTGYTLCDATGCPTAEATMEQKISATGGTSENTPIVDQTADHWIIQGVSMKEQAGGGATNSKVAGPSTLAGSTTVK